MTLRQLPNVITVIRIILIPPALWYLYHGDEMSALVVFAIAGFPMASMVFLPAATAG